MKDAFSTALEDEHVLLRKAEISDLPELYRAASDPLIWEQHNAHDRWKEPVFKKFFEDGLVNDLGMFIIISKDTGRIAGSTRYYRFDPETSSVFIGYTFISRSHWGTGLNRKVKKLMLDHAFTHVGVVYFDIYEKNFRSQKAVGKLGATLCKVTGDKLLFRLTRTQWG